MAVSFNGSPTLANILSELNSIGQSGNYNVAMKLPTPVVKATPMAPSKGLYPSYGTGGQTGGASSPGGASGALERLRLAIRSQESGDNYGAVNSQSGASGGYQMMPSNINGVHSGWDYEALGRDVSVQDFIKSPQIQDQIARYKLGQYLAKYGAAGAAVAWYGGPGAVKNMYSRTTQTGGYPSLYAYWQSVLKKMG